MNFKSIKIRNLLSCFLISSMLGLVGNEVSAQSATSLPFTDTFSPASSWNFVNGSTVNKWYLDTAATGAGTYSMYISNNNGVTNAYTTSSATTTVHFYKDFVIPAGTTEVDLNYLIRVGGESGWDFINIYTAPSTTVPVALSYPTGTNVLTVLSQKHTTNGWQSNHHVLNVSAYAGSTMRLIFTWRNDSSGGSMPAGAIDNVSLSVVSCPGVVNIATNNITANSATATWTNNATANGYEYYISTSNTVPTASTVATGSSNTNSVNIGSLSANTLYYLWVRAACTGSNSVWGTAHSFRTACNTFNLPFEELFTAGSQPSCWGNYNNLNSTEANALWRFSGSPGYGASTSINGRTTGTYAWVDASSPYNNLTRVVLESPFINASTLNNPTLKFDWYKYHSTGTLATSPINTSDDNNRLSVEVYNGTTWNVVFSDTSNLAQWRTVEIPLGTSYAINNLQVRFIVNKNTGTNPDFYDDLLLDAVSVIETPSCPTPMSLVNHTITNNSATLSFIANNPTPSIGYEYYYSTSNTAPNATTTISGTATTNTIPLSGLAPNTTYYAWVRAHCSSNDRSAWSNTTTFRTKHVEATPHLQAFTSTAVPTGWSTTGWTISTNTAVGGNPGNSIYRNILSTNASNAFTTTSFGPLRANEQLSFDFKNPDYYSPYTPVGPNSGSYRVLISNDWGNTWTTIDSIPYTTLQPWQSKTIDLSTYSGDIVSFKFEAIYRSGDFYLGFDNIKIDLPPSCASPVNATVSNITNTSATYSWSAPIAAPANTPSIYDYYMSTSNTAPTATTTPTQSNIAATSVNITNLTTNTTYYVWVRGNCGTNGYSDWTQATSFVTKRVVPTPSTEPFATTSTPAGWNTSSWSIGTTSNLNGNPGNALYKNVYSNTTNGTFTTVSYGPINAAEFLSFDYKNPSYYTPYNPVGDSSGYFKISISNDWGNTWTLLDSIRNSNDSSWTTITKPLSAYVGQIVSFKVETTWEDQDYNIGFDNFNIQPNSCASLVVNLGADTAICQGDTLVLNAGNSGATYLWSNNATTPSIQVNNAGTYWVEVTDGTCIKRDSIVVNVTALPIVNLGNDTTICNNAALVLNAGNTGATFLWNTNQTTQSIVAYNTSLYWVTVTQGNCSAKDSIYIRIPTVLPLNLGADTNICEGATIRLDFDTVARGRGTYLWSNQDTTSVLYVNTAGTYWVTYTAQGCTTTDTINIGIHAAPIVNLGMDVSICNGDSIILDAANSGSTYLWNDSTTNQTLAVYNAGTYSVMVTNTNGCSASDSINVSIQALPNATAITTTRNGGGNYTFNVSNGTNIDRYVWNFGDNSTGNGAPISHSYATNGTYTVSVTISNDCGDTTLMTSVVVDELSIKNIIKEDDVTIYPNPAQDVINISLKNQNNSIEKVIIYNILGQEVMNKTLDITNNATNININNLSAGIYQIMIYTKDGISIKKVDKLN